MMNRFSMDIARRVARAAGMGGFEDFLKKIFSSFPPSKNGKHPQERNTNKN